jgi:hypothetical protein
MKGVRDNSTLLFFGNEETYYYSKKEKRYNEHQMLNNADMEFHVDAKEKASDIRDKNITHTTDADRPENPYDDCLDPFSVISPEHGGGGRSTEKDMKRMKKMVEVYE